MTILDLRTIVKNAYRSVEFAAQEARIDIETAFDQYIEEHSEANEEAKLAGTERSDEEDSKSKGDKK